MPPTPALPIIRAVWAAVSATPSASVRDLARATGHPVHVVLAALDALERAGYIERTPGARRAVRVRIPLIVTQSRTVLTA